MKNPSISLIIRAYGNKSVCAEGRVIYFALGIRVTQRVSSTTYLAEEKNEAQVK